MSSRRFLLSNPSSPASLSARLALAQYRNRARSVRVNSEVSNDPVDLCVRGVLSAQLFKQLTGASEGLCEVCESHGIAAHCDSDGIPGHPHPSRVRCLAASGGKRGKKREAPPESPCHSPP